MGLPQWLSSEDSTCSVGKAGLISGSGRSPGGGNGNPLSILAGGSQGQGNGVTKSQTQLKPLSTYNKLIVISMNLTARRLN